MMSLTIPKSMAGASALLALLFATRIGLADVTAADRETARTLMQSGGTAFREQNYAAALEAYRAADAIMRVPTTGLALARTEAALGKLVDARDAALAVLRMPVKADEPRAYARARKDANALALDLATHIPTLNIRIQGVARGTTVELSIDGAPVSASGFDMSRRID